MGGIRAKITPGIDTDGFVTVRVDWVHVENEVPGEVVATEEFRVNPSKFGSSYFSKAEFNEDGGEFREATFYTDVEGKRHFYVKVESGQFDNSSQPVNLFHS